MMQEKRSDSAGANLVWRRFSGPEADEIFAYARPDPGAPTDISLQTAALYQQLDSLLREEKGSLENIVQEVVFFRNIRRDFEPFQKAQLKALGAPAGAPPRLPASTFIEQPPLDPHAGLVISAMAIIPRGGSLQGGDPNSPARGRSLLLGKHRHLWAGSIYGKPGSAYDQTISMFCRADGILAREGMNFQDVVRTWIYLRHMERDYAEFNRGRREFFRRRQITLLPASTGISGSPLPEETDFALSLCAIRAPQRLAASAMTTPTLNEARTYGADFSRGLRVVEENRIALYISGTASVNEEGSTAHANDFAGQVNRMLLNVETLLSEQQASFRDVLSAVTYLTKPDDVSILRRILRDRGLDDLPNAMVHAAVCRPDLLCEMEAVAALPLPGPRRAID
jgi:enamine deaminase RidA (YjgF/YER057c/UK114 family)